MSKNCLIKDCERLIFCKKFCQNHYYRLWKHGDPLGGAVSKGDCLKFLKQAASTPKSNKKCILWPYDISNSGYGRIRWKKKNYNAHRLCLIFANGSPPTKSHLACHAPVVCHNRKCINPNHLIWQTYKQNMRDKIADGTNVYGSDHPQSKLSAKQVIKIREDQRPQRQIAAHYKICQATVSEIKTNKIWAWL